MAPQMSCFIGLALAIFLLIQMCIGLHPKEITLDLSPPVLVVYIVTGTSFSSKCSLIFHHPSHLDLKETYFEWQHELRNLAGQTGHLITVKNRSTELTITNISRMNEGMYHCFVKNQTNQAILAERNITVRVGEPPSTPRSPTLVHVYGYPPVDVVVAYAPNVSKLSSYPITVELLVCSASQPGASIDCCFNALSPLLKVIKKSTRVIRSRYESSSTIKLDVSEVVKELFPVYPQCSTTINATSPFDCTIMGAFVRQTNSFGVRSSPPNPLHLLLKSTCGIVNEISVWEVKPKSVTVTWTIPVTLINTTYTYHYYLWWCYPSCGEKIHIERSILNYTLSALNEFTEYTFYVACLFDFNDDFDSKYEANNVTVRTSEGVPSVFPRITKLDWVSREGVALVSWEPVTDSRYLRGREKAYIINYWVSKNPLNQSRLTIKPNNQTYISGLNLNKNYTFTIQVCSGGGCGNQSGTYLLQADVNDDSTKVHSGSSDSSLVWLIAVSTVIIVVLLAGVASYVCYKLRSAHNDPVEELPDDLNRSKECLVPVTTDESPFTSADYVQLEEQTSLSSTACSETPPDAVL